MTKTGKSARLALCAPLLLSGIWLTLNRAYPETDEGFYFFLSQKLFFVFKKKGLLAFLRAAYFTREWHQSMHSFYGSLALIGLNGNVLGAIRLTNLCYLSILLFFTYSGFRLFLSREKSAMAAALMGLLPWVQQVSHFFDAYFPALAFTSGALYYLYRSFQSERVRDCFLFGLFLGLGVCIQTSEPLLFLSVPILFWIFFKLRSGFLSWRDLLACAFTVIPLQVFFFREFYFLNSPHGLFRIVLLCLPAALIFIFRKPLKLNHAFLAAFATAYFLAVFWYGPFLAGVAEMYRLSTYGSAATSVRAASGIGSALDFWVSIAKELGGWASALLLTGVIVSVPRLERRWVFQIGVALAAVLLPIALGSFTPNPSNRYYYASAYFGECVLLGILLSNAPRSKFFARSFFALSAIFSLAWVGTSIALPNSLSRISNNPNNDALAFTVGPVFQYPPSVFIQELQKQLGRKLTGEHRISYFPFSTRLNEFSLFDRRALSIIARERGDDWEFIDRPPPLEMSKADLLLVGPLGGKPRNSTPEETRDFMLATATEEELPSFGWEELGVFTLKGVEETQTFRLLKGLLPESLKSDWNQVKARSPGGISGLSAWLKADSLRNLPDGSIVQLWKSSDPKTRVFQSLTQNGAPVLRARGMNGKPALEFKDGSFFQSVPLRENELLGKDQATVLLVLKAGPLRPISDVFGWGDCEENRYLLHWFGNSQFFFHCGRREFDLKAPVEVNPNSRPHLAVFLRKGKLAEAIIDGRLVNSTYQLSFPELVGEHRLMIGQSPCGNGFSGEIAEAIFYRRALSESELLGVLRFLSEKYELSLGR